MYAVVVVVVGHASQRHAKTAHCPFAVPFTAVGHNCPSRTCLDHVINLSDATTTRDVAYRSICQKQLLSSQRDEVSAVLQIPLHCIFSLSELSFRLESALLPSLDQNLMLVMLVLLFSWGIEPGIVHCCNLVHITTVGF